MKRRSVWWLFGSWIAYWLVVAGVKLGPAAVAIWRATRGPESGKNSVSFSAGSEGLKLVVAEHARTTWSGSISIAGLIAWVALVPLALWVAWFVAARSDAPAPRERATSRAAS